VAGIEDLYDLSAEDIAALHESEIREHIAAIDREFAGRSIKADRKTAELWNALNEQLEEFEVREQRIRELVGKGQVESSTDPYQTRRPIRRTVARDEPRHRAAAREVGLRAINMHAEVLTAKAGDTLEDLVRDPDERDRYGLAGRYLEAVSDPNYESAFWRLLRDPQFGHVGMTDAETHAIRRAQSVMRERDFVEGRERAMSLTTTSGGFAVPFVLDPSVLRVSDGAINPYRSISNVEVIGVDEWRGVSSAGITATFQAEAAAVTDASPTLAQPVVSTEMARAFVPYSIEVGMDWASFQNEMAGLFADAKDVLEATKFAVGSGTNEPFGVITGATTLFTASNTNSLVVADLYGVHNALGPRFRTRATWTLNNAVADRIRQLDTAGGANLWSANLTLRTAAVPATLTDGRMGADLLGKPVYEATAQSGAFTTGQKVAVVGDYSRAYKIVDRVGMNIEIIPHLFGAAQGNLPTGQQGLFAYWRTGAKVLDANAFRVLRLA
jgi:HK97 family phage major capsid protein